MKYGHLQMKVPFDIPDSWEVGTVWKYRRELRQQTPPRNQKNSEKTSMDTTIIMEQQVQSIVLTITF